MKTTVISIIPACELTENGWDLSLSISIYVDPAEWRDLLYPDWILKYNTLIIEIAGLYDKMIAKRLPYYKLDIPIQTGNNIFKMIWYPPTGNTDMNLLRDFIKDDREEMRYKLEQRYPIKE
tara:strand:+ start:193 stop:555 length:363 start_codon:yes stop_codon:yes gene_type:complete